jgi:hypothetical protein
MRVKWDKIVRIKKGFWGLSDSFYQEGWVDGRREFYMRCGDPDSGRTVLYNDCPSWGKCYGVFKTIDDAKRYAERVAKRVSN